MSLNLLSPEVIILLFLFSIFALPRVKNHASKIIPIVRVRENQRLFKFSVKNVSTQKFWLKCCEIQRDCESFERMGNEKVEPGEPGIFVGG